MNIRRITIVIAGAAVALPFMAFGSSAQARPATPAAAPTASTARQAENATAPIQEPWMRSSLVKLGWVGGYRGLVDGSGKALYLFTPDRRGYSACYGGCAREWPPFYGRAHAGLGIAGWALGYTMRRDGSTQATYFGRPLYHYTGDWHPGQANGQGMDGTWYLIDAAGNPIGGWPWTNAPVSAR